MKLEIRLGQSPMLLNLLSVLGTLECQGGAGGPGKIIGIKIYLAYSPESH